MRWRLGRSRRRPPSGHAPRRRRTHGVAGVAAGTAAALLAVAGCGGPRHAPAPHRTTRSAAPGPSWNPKPTSVAAVGDSITRGFDACGLLSDCPSVSWSTGTDAAVDSLAVRLLGPAGAKAHSWNLAVSGARMADLPAQMTRVAAHRPGLVTVLAGANDACRPSVSAMTSLASFRASFETALHRLRAASPRTEVYVASVPDLRRLWAQGHGNPLGRAVWKLGICASMLGSAKGESASAATERRQTVYDRVVAYNGVLRSVCAKDALCRYDGGAVFGYRFSAALLSPWDLFHPSRTGQGTLARIAYSRVTAAGSAA
ncbi:SGNH/GDSL hydrolase family protein [Streptomyces sp. DW26H14]|uniref:SGNH/GDSL hydrolase family protein n=1 Tax=Streptomyces sp. DW26H14 TaxID=3435395 RepID=UPI00403DE3AA